MKASIILKEAAKRVMNFEEHEIIGGCAAIKWQEYYKGKYIYDDDIERAYSYYASLFEPVNSGCFAFWFPAEEANEQRILALLLTAAIAESVGD